MRRNTLDEVIASMPAHFHPEACSDIRAVYQWHVAGDGGRDFHIVVDHGTFKVIDGVASSPDVTLRADLTTYLRLSNQELKPMTALLTRKLVIHGNIYLGSKMDHIFR